LLCALYLILALSVPGAFLIAKQVSVASSSQPILSAERSSEQFGGSAGEDRGEHSSWQGPKRLRGVLPLPKVGIDKIVNFLLIAPLGGPKTLLEEDAEGNKLIVADEVQPSQDEAFPQELLGRSPPLSR
jgi:hypothetical protein